MDNRQRSLLIAEQISQSELVGLIFELVPVANVRLFPDYVKGLHAWFLQQIQRVDPELSAYLHDGQTEKAFSLSRLAGPLEIRGREIHLTAQQTYYWHLNLLSARTVQGVSNWLSQPPAYLELARNRLYIKNIEFSLPALTYEELWQGAAPSTLELSFLTPTSFRRKGNHFPLPVPSNIFNSYLRRWNDFSGRSVDSDAFLEWVEESIRIDRHWLESLKITGIKGGNFTGFVGAIALSLTPTGQKHRLFRNLFGALGRFAPYCGTGHKTTFGLGQTCLGWDLPQNGRLLLFQEASQEQVLANRIDTLTESLLKQQKRTGGERALKSCQLKATILARRELGESLQAIATDLQISYETVKTYIKRARQELKSVKTTD